MTTAQQNAITVPAKGLLIYNTSDNTFKVNTGTAVAPEWTTLSFNNGATTHTISSSTNTISSTVNGVTATTPIVNSVANASATNTLTTTVNGVSATGVPIINSNVLSLSGNTLISTVNGVASNSTELSSITSVAAYSENTITNNYNNNGLYTLNDLNIGGKTLIRLTGTAFNQLFHISGINGGVAGKTIIIYNTGNGNMVLDNLNAGSSSANQINTLTGGSANTNGSGSITLVYDGTAAKWIVTGIQQ
jgi:hypothetical protein